MSTLVFFAASLYSNLLLSIIMEDTRTICMDYNAWNWMAPVLSCHPIPCIVVFQSVVNSFVYCKLVPSDT